MAKGRFNQYCNQIRRWDWQQIKQAAYANPIDTEMGSREGLDWLGTTLGIMPSGKIYAPWTSNQTKQDVYKDATFLEALERVADEHGMYITWFDDSCYAGVDFDGLTDEEKRNQGLPYEYCLDCDDYANVCQDAGTDLNALHEHELRDIIGKLKSVS